MGWPGTLVLVLATGAWAIPAQAQQSQGGNDDSVRPGDRIVLQIWNEPQMSDTFSVTESGQAILPKLGAVSVMGSPVAVLQDSLRAAYMVYLRNPSVSVSVLRRVGVHGEVHTPGLYWVNLTMTLRDIIAEAGGVTDDGDPNKVFIVRDGTRMQVGRGNDAQFVTAALHSGDQVVVGARPWIERNSLAFASTAAVVISLLIPVIKSF